MDWLSSTTTVITVCIAILGVLGSFALLIFKVGNYTGKVDHIITILDDKFEKIDKKFDQIDRKFERIDRKFDQIDKRFEIISVDISELKSNVSFILGILTKNTPLEDKFKSK